MTGIPERGGLQPERTALSWQRTTLVSTLIAVPVMVLGVRLADWLAAGAGGCAAIAGVLITSVERTRTHQLLDEDVTASRWPLLAAVASVVTLTATAATLLAVRIALRER